VNHIGVDTQPYLIGEPKEWVRYRRGGNAVQLSAVVVKQLYNNCVEAIRRGGITTWPELVPIKIGVDFVLSGPPVTTCTRI
jgi:hypothetical protein